MPRKTTAKKTTASSRSTGMTAMTVYEWAGHLRTSSFTTDQVAEHFNIAKTRAAAFVAILRIKERIRPASDAGTWALA